MGKRELPVLVQQVVDARRFEYADWVIFTLPLRAGETAPIVIRAAKQAFVMESRESFVVFAALVYLGVLDRLPLPEETDDWLETLEALSQGDFAPYLQEVKDRLEALFAGAAYAARGRTNPEYVRDLYAAYMGRDPDVGGYDFWVGQLSLGTTREAVRAEFAGTEEFSARVAGVAQPVAFDPDIKSFGQVAFSEGRAIDNVEGVLHNLNNRYGKILTASDRLIYPSRAVMGRAFLCRDGIWRGDDIVIGTVKFVTVTKTEAPFLVTSDMSLRGATVAELVPQRCGRLYKGPGCNSPDPSPTCSLRLNDEVNGCKSKLPDPTLVGAVNNVWRFYAVTPDVAVPSTRPLTGDGRETDFDGVFIDPRRQRLWEHVNRAQEGAAFQAL